MSNVIIPNATMPNVIMPNVIMPNRKMKTFQPLCRFFTDFYVNFHIFHNNFHAGLLPILRPILLPVLLSVLFSVLFLQTHSPAQDLPAKNLPAQDTALRAEKEKQTAERFWKVLQQSPRYGTAFDKVYHYHADSGTLPELAEKAGQLARAEPDNGKAFFVLGLIAAKQNHTREAESALKKAGELLPDNPLPDYYLAEIFTEQGKIRDAAERLERALSRNPAKSDRMTMTEQLGGLYERLGKTEKADSVWQQLEKDFPGNIDVMKRIARNLERAGKHEAALQQYLKLADLTKGKDSVRLPFVLAAADMKIKLGSRAAALHDLESLLDSLDEKTYTAETVRSRIEQLFGRQGDFAGLAEFYKKRLTNHPDETETLRRLALTLHRLSRTDEAKKLLQSGAEKMPRNIPLRLALIELYRGEKNRTAANRLYEEVCRIEPDNPDLLTQWGRDVLADNTAGEPERKAKTAAIWNRIAEPHPRDAALTLFTADLFAANGFPEQAETLFLRAASLQPESRVYERLGLFYHKENQPEKAAAAFWKIAEGSKRNSETLLQTADLLDAANQPKEALKAVLEAVRLEPQRFDVRLRAADMFLRTQNFSAAEEQLRAAEPLTETDEEEDVFVRFEIRLRKAAGQLEQFIAQLKAKLETASETKHDVKQETKQDAKLALFLAAAGKPDEAAKAAERGLQRGCPSPMLFRIAADIAAKTDDHRRAVALLQELIKTDPARKTEYLRKLAVRFSGIGDLRQAEETLGLAVAAGAETAENLRLLADIQFAAGKEKEGIESLRRAVRTAPPHPDLTMLLSDVLFRTGHTDEAAETLWTYFDKQTSRERKLAAVEKLAVFYQQMLRFEQMIERLQKTANMTTANNVTENNITENNAAINKDGFWYLAGAYSAVSAFAEARETLESALRDHTGNQTDDQEILLRLSQLAEKQGDQEGAVRYQELLCGRRGDLMNQARLADLYFAAKQTEKGNELRNRIETALKQQNVRETNNAANNADNNAANDADNNADNAAKSGSSFHRVLIVTEILRKTEELDRADISGGEKLKRFTEIIQQAENAAAPHAAFVSPDAFDAAFLRFFQILQQDYFRQIPPEFSEQIRTAASRWNQILNKVPHGPKVIRTVLTIRNEKSVRLLETETAKQTENDEDRKLNRNVLRISDAFENNVYQMLDRMRKTESLFARQTAPPRPNAGRHWYTILNLSRTLLHAETDANGILVVNLNLVDYLLTRADLSPPMMLVRGTSQPVFESVCGTLSAMDELFAAEKPAKEIQPSEIRTDRTERLQTLLDSGAGDSLCPNLPPDSLPNSQKNSPPDFLPNWKGNADLIREVFIVQKQNIQKQNEQNVQGQNESKQKQPETARALSVPLSVPFSVPLSLELLKQKAARKQADSDDPAVWSARILLALAEDEDDQALNLLEQIPCPTAAEIKARELLLLSLAAKRKPAAKESNAKESNEQQQKDEQQKDEQQKDEQQKDEHWQRRADAAAETLLGYQLSEDELVLFWELLKKRGQTAEAANIRRRLTAVAKKMTVLAALLNDWKQAAETGESAEEQAVFLALKILRSPAVLSESVQKNCFDVLTRSGKLDEITGQFESRVKSVPGSPDGVRQLAEIYLLTGRKTEAVQLLEQTADNFKNLPPDNPSLLHYAEVLRKAGMNAPADRWMQKYLLAHPDLLIKNFSVYREQLGTALVLDTLEQLDCRAAAGNVFAIFSLLQSLQNDPVYGKQADKIRTAFWCGDSLNDAERITRQQSALRAMFRTVRLDNVQKRSDEKYSDETSDPVLPVLRFLEEWILAVLSSRPEISANIHQVWSWADHQPKTFSLTYLEYAAAGQKNNGKNNGENNGENSGENNGEMLNQTLASLRRILAERLTEPSTESSTEPAAGGGHEKVYTAKYAAKYTAAKIFEAMILLELGQTGEGQTILRTLESQAETKPFLGENALAAALALDGKPDAADDAIRFYERAFQKNPHRAYAPFFLSKLYPLYMQSKNPQIAEKGVQTALQKYRDVLLTIKKIEEEWGGSDRLSEEKFGTLEFLLRQLGTALLQSGHAGQIRTLHREVLTKPEWLEKLKADAKHRSLAALIEDLTAKAAAEQGQHE